VSCTGLQSSDTKLGFIGMAGCIGCSGDQRRLHLDRISKWCTRPMSLDQLWTHTGRIPGPKQQHYLREGEWEGSGAWVEKKGGQKGGT